MAVAHNVGTDGTPDWRRWFVRGCLGLAAATVVLGLYLGHDLWRARADARAALVLAQDHTTDEAAANIARVITEVETVAQSTAREIAALPEPEPAIDDIIERLIARHPDIAAIGVAFEPFAFNPQYRLAAPIVTRTATGFERGRIETDYDYTAPTVAWYAGALAKGAIWDRVRTDPVSGEKFVDFALRVRLMTGRRAVAVVRISYPVARIAEIVTHLDLGHHGYGVLISPEGRPLVSPGVADRSGLDDDEPAEAAPPENPERVVDEHLGDDPVETVGAPLDRDLAQAVMQARTSARPVEFKSALTGHKSRLTTRIVKGPGWTLATIYSWRDLRLDFTARHREVLVMTILGVLLPIFLGSAHVAAAGAGPFRRAVRIAWIWSTGVAITFVIAIGAIWALALEGPGTLLASGQAIASRGALDSFERKVLRQSLEEGRPLPAFVPTGIFVQSVEFLSANNLVLTGYVWQRYPKDSPLTRGIVLPEAEEAEITEVFRHDKGRDEVIGWRVRVTLRQVFSYARFPFDRESVWIRLWPADLEHPAVLVPDFASYKMTNPSALPGLERSLFISGWTPISTFFEYRRNGYTTDFGIDASMSHGGRQELYFNVEIVRNFLDPFVSHITPILLVLLLIFAMQMTVTRQAEQKDLLGFNAATIITTCAALFFAVLISHIEVRGALAAKKIFYGEYFYLITYGVILAACINAILFTYDSSLRWVQYRDNLLPKILYWPVVMTAMYAVTFSTFY